MNIRVKRFGYVGYRLAEAVAPVPRRMRRRRRRDDMSLQGWIRDSRLEDRCLLSGILMPSDTVSPARGPAAAAPTLCSTTE